MTNYFCLLYYNQQCTASTIPYRDTRTLLISNGSKYSDIRHPPDPFSVFFTITSSPSSSNKLQIFTLFTSNPIVTVHSVLPPNASYNLNTTSPLSSCVILTVSNTTCFVLTLKYDISLNPCSVGLHSIYRIFWL